MSFIKKLFYRKENSKLNCIVLLYENLNKQFNVWNEKKGKNVFKIFSENVCWVEHACFLNFVCKDVSTQDTTKTKKLTHFIISHIAHHIIIIRSLFHTIHVFFLFTFSRILLVFFQSKSSMAEKFSLKLM